MTSETRSAVRPPPSGHPWPPDDTEESVLGTDRHQLAITNIRWGINEVARLGLPPGQPPPFRAFSQTMLLGCRRPDGSAYRTYPDIFVYAPPIDPDRGAATLRDDGPPALVAEVLSPATAAVDLDLDAGKGYSYARAAISEYLVLDPTRHYLPAGLGGWRLVEGAYRPWQPAADGRWHSARLPLVFGVADEGMAVFARDGRRMLREGEVEAERAHLHAELARLRRLLDEARGRG